MNAPDPQHVPTLDLSAAQLLGVQSGGRLYGIDLQRVHEIRRGAAPPHAVTAEGSVPGMLNLRGEFVPLLHLRARLGLPLPPPGTEAAMVLLAVKTTAGPRECALVVDAVADVVEAGDSVVPPGGGTPQVPVQLDVDALLADYLRQNAGVNSTSAVNSSIRPRNIATIHSQT
jgi:chemotaxis signal transduction protein